MIARSQRERLLEAAIRVVAEKGYAATTVADLTREAGISRTTFYGMFEDKEGCFLAAYDGVIDALVRRVTAAYEAEEGWPNRARAGLAALLEALAEEPAIARMAARARSSVLVTSPPSACGRARRPRGTWWT